MYSIPQVQTSISLSSIKKYIYIKSTSEKHTAALSDMFFPHKKCEGSIFVVLDIFMFKQEFV